jgi:hypothetical protein
MSINDAEAERLDQVQTAADLVHWSRTEQGLPSTVTDPSVIAVVAALLREHPKRQP